VGRKIRFDENEALVRPCHIIRRKTGPQGFDEMKLVYFDLDLQGFHQNQFPLLN